MVWRLGWSLGTWLHLDLGWESALFSMASIRMRSEGAKEVVDADMLPADECIKMVLLPY